MLAFQNSKLKAQLEVKRDEFADLDRRHQQLLSKQASYQDNLLIVDRLWKQVNGDIHLLAERAIGNPAGRTQALTLQRDSKADYDSFEDPFLERLLQSDATLHSATRQSLKSLQSDASELELALRKKLSSTVESFARVLDEIRKGQQHRAELAQQIETQLLPDSVSAVTTKQLADNVHCLQRTVDNQQAYIRTLEANLAQTDDEFVRHNEQIRDMNNQLADLDEQLAKARKSQRAMNGQHPAVAPKIEPNQPNGFTSASSGSQLQEGAPKQTFMLTKSLEETVQLLSKRDIELEQEREAGFALARYCFTVHHVQAMLWANLHSVALLFLVRAIPTCATAWCHTVQGGQGFEGATEQSGQPASKSERARDSARARYCQSRSWPAASSGLSTGARCHQNGSNRASEEQCCKPSMTCCNGLLPHISSHSLPCTMLIFCTCIMALKDHP